MWSSILSVVLVINELMASNAGVVMSPAINFDSWIEIYNPSDQKIDMSGMYLSNDPNNLRMWRMPGNVGSIPAKGYKVIWLGSNDIKETQASFKLDCDGGTICLSDKSGNLLSSVNYPEALSRTAYARTTDGGDIWGWTAYPTPEATNATSIFATERLSPPQVNMGSQLFSGSLEVVVDIPEGATLIYTTDGSLPTANPVSEITPNEPYWKNWVRNSDCEGSDASCFVCRDGNGNGDIPRITDGAGVNGSRGAKVHSIEKPEHDWDSQFFVYTPDHVWYAGDKFHFSMKVKADKPSHITVESHTTPGGYIHYEMLNNSYDITTKWETIDYVGTITKEQAGESGLQTIAFKLNVDAQENNFYFDDIVWEQYFEPTPSVTTITGKQSKNGIFSVQKTTNYVFRLFKEGFLPSVPVTRSFIQTDNSYTIPVVSIVGDEKYFTDPKIGIDCDGDGTNGKTGNGQDQPRNYNNDWDRPVNFSYIDPSGGMLFNQDVNISVSGGWTRAANPRSMKLKANKIFDGQNRFDYSFFPQKPYIRNKALLIRNGGNDVWNNQSRFMDPALATIIQRSGIDVDIQSFLQVAEYINGRFKGILNLRETNNDKFVYANFGYDDEEIDMFENNTFKNGSSSSYDRLCQLAANSADANTYEEIKRLLDVDEFINYMAVEIYLGNDDWPENNVKAYRSQNDGRYRFICFDLDFAFNPWGRNTLTQALDDQSSKTRLVPLFINLLKNDTFRRQFIDTYCIVAGSVFEKNRAISIVNELANTMRPMSQIDGLVPDNAANKIIENLRTRLDIMMTRLQQYSPMKLSGVKKQSVAVATDVEGATLLINGIEVPYASFNGKLFAPIKIEAKAPAGYSFTGWRKSSNSTVQLIKINDTWKYYDKGQPASNWNASSFNDNTWASGPAPLGYKMTGVKTTVSFGPDANSKYPTTYFRKTINLSASPRSNDLFQLNYQVDDGFVVYVNGKEAGRYNMPNGNITFNSFSSSYAGDTPLTGTLDLSPSLFKSGSNVIAVEIHNNQASSSDQYWACELLTTVGASSGDAVITNPIISLSENDNNISLVACFKPLTDAERLAKGLTPVCINEVSAANNIYVNDYFKRNDWIELYNTTDADINVEGMYLSDNLENPKKYQISGGGASTTIPAHGYLVIWCDKLGSLSQLHASFKLDADGGDVLLTAKDESWSNRLTYTSHKENETVGRYPDGASDVFVMNVPTIGKANITSSYVTVVQQPGSTGIHDLMADETENLSIRYVSGLLVIHSEKAEDLKVRITNLAGQHIATLPLSMTNGYAEVSVEQLPVGVYIANITDHQGHKATCKFIKR